MEISIVELFGELPVAPKDFREKISVYECMRYAKESSFCITCGTLEPYIPNKHHNECCSYKDCDAYEKHINEFGCCPECGDDDSLQIDSSREMRQSIISCTECNFSFSKNCDEETLTKKFNKKYRK